MKPTRVTKVIVLVSVAVLAGTAGAASAGAPNGQTKEDLLKSVSLIHQLETAIRTKDDKGVTKASDSLEALWHRYRGTVPDWMRSSGAKISNGKYSVKNSAHQMARTSGGYTLENLDALSEAIARNVLVPIYPAVGQIEILYHDLFRLSGASAKT